MSFFQILVCIFLCIHSNTGEISYDNSVDFSSITSVSRMTSGFAALNRQLLRASYQDLLSKRKIEIDLQKQFLEIDKQIEPVYAYQKLFMISQQNGDRSPVDQSEKLEELFTKRDALKQSLNENELQEDHARLAYQKALRNIKDADTIQKMLQKRAGDLDELQSDGFYNAEHTIPDMDDIPEYGSVKNNDIHSDIACLLDGPMDIDSSSDFWLWPVPNGMISAGTWSYPRGRNASWIGYCCRYVQ